MAEWPNGRMAEWPNGRMAEWPNGRMAEWRWAICVNFHVEPSSWTKQEFKNTPHSPLLKSVVNTISIFHDAFSCRQLARDLLCQQASIPLVAISPHPVPLHHPLIQLDAEAGLLGDADVAI